MTEAKRESWSPRLRADVRLDREGARPCLVDPRFARRIPAGPLTQALAERLTGALLDRLTHHVNILEMNGDSYRLAQSRARNSADT